MYLAFFFFFGPAFGGSTNYMFSIVGDYFISSPTVAFHYKTFYLATDCEGNKCKIRRGLTYKMGC